MAIKANRFKPNFLNPLAEICDPTAEPMDVDAEITLTVKGQRVMIETRCSSLLLKAQGTISELPGDINLSTVVESTNLEAIGRYFDVKLPDLPARVSAIVTKKGDLLALSELRFDSDVAEVSGLANSQLATKLSFDTTLDINVQNARNLADSLPENSGLVGAFPFKSSPSVHGSEKLLELDNFVIRVGNHRGRASGSFGEPFTWRGLDLELKLSGHDLQHLLPPKIENAIG